MITAALPFPPPANLLEQLRRARRVLCISHVNPDGDAYGSLLAMVWILRALGKEATPAMDAITTGEFAFLPGIAEVIAPAAVAPVYDLVVCLDASSPDRMGAAWRAEIQATPLAVIDHHRTNTLFGAVNWVESACAATCQMLLYLAQALDVPVAGPLATCLLTGLVTDTLGFRTSNTSAEVLEAAMMLQRSGVSVAEIAGQTVGRMPLTTLRLWGRVLQSVEFAEGVLWATVRLADLAAVGAGADEAKISSILATVAEAEMSAVFTEKLGESGQPQVECSFRAKPGFNVADLAFSFGGGGHAPAAGCTVDGTLTEMIPLIVGRLQEERRRQSGRIQA